MGGMDWAVKLCVAAGALFLSLPYALGYIDPGTGGLVVSSTGSYLLALLGAAGAFVAVRLIKPLAACVRRLLRRGG